MSSPCASSHASASCAADAPRSFADRLPGRPRARRCARGSPARSAGASAGGRSAGRSSTLRDAPGQEPPPERRVGDVADAELAARRHDVALDVAEPQRVLGLQRGERMLAVGALAASSTPASQMPMKRTLPRSMSRAHRADRFLDRHARIDAVQVIDVDHVDAEPLQARVAATRRTYSGRPLVAFLPSGRSMLPNLVATSTWSRNGRTAATEKRFVPSAPVGVRPIEERDAELAGAAYRRVEFLLERLAGPDGLAAPADADRGNERAVLPSWRIFQAVFFRDALSFFAQ